ncbi:hypothetical protein Cgig2_016546 [Carnegiea gigantea]|uniref:Uncharacterized protein n=1 Tax=Carnegiea gigantea TaxID=171969 RepID=A0A9Q1GNK1_9CARY|nr:hypothetical protein Cgig2_016546 [Carnegiea gigantea]
MRNSWGTLSYPPKLPKIVDVFRSYERFLIMVFPYFRSTKEMADHVRETFNWHLRGAVSPPRPLLENYRDLCLDFIISDAEEAAHDFRIPKIVQAVFYAMVVNQALELGVLSRALAEDLKLALVRAFVPSLKVTFILYYLIMSFSYSSSGTVPGKLASSRIEGRHPQFPNLPVLVDGRVVTIEEDVVYPWEIDVAVSRMTDVQEQKLARTKQIARPKTVL